MDIRMIIESDYDNILCKWWNDWKWTPPAKESLPLTGIIVSKDGVDICAGFVYFTNSKMVWVEYIISNINYREKDRKEIIEYTINGLCAIAFNQGFKYIYTSLTNESLMKRYSNCGFIKGSSGCQEMIKING